MQHFRRPQQVSVKGRGNLVTATDVNVERLIQSILAQEYPHHAVLSEEASTSADGRAVADSRVVDTRPEAQAEWMWVVDPVDGTRNYVSG